MTNKDASVIIGNIPIEGDDCYTIAEYQEAKAMAIKALKQQPSEDCISRQAVLDYIYNKLGLGDEENGNDIERQMELESSYKYIRALPSVKPKYTDEEIDKAQAVEQAYVDKMVELAVKETERPKGKWIEIEIDAGEFIYKCTKCGMRVINPYKYCPNCGSYNGGNDNGDE